jgi:hypothetical protein
MPATRVRRHVRDGAPVVAHMRRAVVRRDPTSNSRDYALREEDFGPVIGSPRLDWATMDPRDKRVELVIPHEGGAIIVPLTPRRLKVLRDSIRHPSTLGSVD